MQMTNALAYNNDDIYTAAISNNDDAMRRRLAVRYRRRGPFYLSCLPATSSPSWPPSVHSRPPATASPCRGSPTVEDLREEAVRRRRGQLWRKAVWRSRIGRTMRETSCQRTFRCLSRLTVG